MLTDSVVETYFVFPTDVNMKKQDNNTNILNKRHNKFRSKNILAKKKKTLRIMDGFRIKRVLLFCTVGSSTPEEMSN
jgi:hypothetical protein